MDVELRRCWHIGPAGSANLDASSWLLVGLDVTSFSIQAPVRAVRSHGRLAGRRLAFDLDDPRNRPPGTLGILRRDVRTTIWYNEASLMIRLVQGLRYPGGSGNLRCQWAFVHWQATIPLMKLKLLSTRRLSRAS